jgi:DNA-binding transcriptional ArsR family regulator
LKKAGLLESRRIGKWTYYRYHRAGVEALLQQLREQI